jgi:hypothetical protein
MKEHLCPSEQSMITYEGECNWCGERDGSMTQDDVIEMAQECNLIGMRPHLDGIYSESLIAFAKLVAAKKQERIIEVVERLGTWAHITEVVAEIRGEA